MLESGTSMESYCQRLQILRRRKEISWSSPIRFHASSIWERLSLVTRHSQNSNWNILQSVRIKRRILFFISSSLACLCENGKTIYDFYQKMGFFVEMPSLVMRLCDSSFLAKLHSKLNFSEVSYQKSSKFGV